MPLFIQITNVLDLHFQGQRFESSMLFIGKFKRNVLTNGDREDILLLPTLMKLNAAYCKVQGQGHAHFDCEYPANGDI